MHVETILPRNRNTKKWTQQPRTDKSKAANDTWCHHAGHTKTKNLHLHWKWKLTISSNERNEFKVEPKWSDRMVWGSLTDLLCNSLYSLTGFLHSSLRWGITVCCSQCWTLVSFTQGSSTFALILWCSGICGSCIQGVAVWRFYVHQNQTFVPRSRVLSSFNGRPGGGGIVRGHLFSPLHIEEDVCLGLPDGVLIGQSNRAVVKVVPAVLVAAICCIMPWSNPVNRFILNIILLSPLLQHFLLHKSIKAAQHRLLEAEGDHCSWTLYEHIWTESSLCLVGTWIFQQILSKKAFKLKWCWIIYTAIEPISLLL